MTPPLFLIRAMLDTGTPVIYTGNWPVEHSKGWRFVMNMFITDVQGCMDSIKNAQIEYGKDRVAVGQAFNESTMKPEAAPGICGLFVKDVEAVIEETMKELDDLDAVARWLHN